MAATRLDDIRDFKGSRFTDDVPDRRRAEKDLDRGNHAVAIDTSEQGLRNDRLQRVPEHGPHLVLLPRRVHVDDALHGLGRIHGVQGREDQVPGLRRRERQGRRFQVPHFADEDDVRILPQRVLESGGEMTACRHRAHAAR